MTGWTRAFVGGAVAVALLVGCGGGDDGAGSSGSTDSTVAADAFDGAAPTVDGGEVDLADFGERDLVVWFWAPW